MGWDRERWLDEVGSENDDVFDPDSEHYGAGDSSPPDNDSAFDSGSDWSEEFDPDYFS